MSAAPPIPRAEREGLGILREVEHPGCARGLWLHPWMWDLGGNGAGDPGASCPSAPGHCSRAVGSPENTCRGFPWVFPYCCQGYPSWTPEPQKQQQLGTVWVLGFPTGNSPRTWTPGLVPLTLCRECSSQAGSGAPAAPWDVSALTPVPIPLKDSNQGSQKASPTGISRAGPSRAWSRGGNTQQCKWGI